MKKGRVVRLDKELDRNLAGVLEKVWEREKGCRDNRFLTGFYYAKSAWKYLRETGKPIPELGTYTSKSLKAGGSKVRGISTALGTIMVLEELVRKRFPEREQWNNPFKGLKVAVQGFGNAGSNAALLLYEREAIMVAVNDSRAGIYKANGLDIEDVIKVKKETGSLSYYRNAERLKDKDDLLYLDVDILIPAAKENVITIDNVERIKAKIIAEAANGPSTLEADKVLFAKWVVIIPDTLANAGGVIVSDYERTQNINGEIWEEEDIKNKLKEQLLETFSAVWNISIEKKIDLRAAFDIYSVSRILEIKRSGLSMKAQIMKQLLFPMSPLTFCRVFTFGW